MDEPSESCCRALIRRRRIGSRTHGLREGSIRCSTSRLIDSESRSENQLVSTRLQASMTTRLQQTTTTPLSHEEVADDLEQDGARGRIQRGADQQRQRDDPDPRPPRVIRGESP